MFYDTQYWKEVSSLRMCVCVCVCVWSGVSACTCVPVCGDIHLLYLAVTFKKHLQNMRVWETSIAFLFI